jgi:hemolysin activation/secretion protein
MSHLHHPRHAIAQLAATVIGTIAFAAHAVTPNPDAGALLRQTEQNLKLKKPPAALQRRNPTPAPVAKPSDASVTVTRFAFAGHTLLSNDALNAAVASYLNRPLNFNELQAAAAAVAQAYREAGCLVTAYLPKQDVSNGVVTIQITEALLGKVSVQSPAPERVAAQRLIQIFESQQPKGQAMQTSRIDRALLLLDDLPGVIVTGNLQAGTSANQTDMVLNAVDEPLIKGDLNTDNYGSVATGVPHASLNASVNSPLRLGDQLQLNSLRTQGSEYTRLAYSVPVGNDGWRAQVRGSNMKHHLVGALAATDGHGSAQTKGGEISYPLLRSQTSNLNFSLGYDLKHYDNYDSTGLTSRYDTRASSMGLSGNHIDASGNTHNYGITWVRGTVDLTDAPAAYATNIQNGPNTAGRYDRLAINLSRQQPLSVDTSLLLAYAAQVANRNLDSSEKIYLEGPSSVRAYGVGATGLGGTEGQTFTAELRHNLDAHWRLSEFYDYGRATANRNNNKADGTGVIADVNNYQLRGVGMTLGWQSIQGIDLKATVARRVGVNPNAKSLDPRLDQDGTYRNPRYWLSATFAF